MPEFTDDQLRYHAAKAGYPAKELAAELLRLREELATSRAACARWNERYTELSHERDALRAKLARVVSFAVPAMEVDGRGDVVSYRCDLCKKDSLPSTDRHHNWCPLAEETNDE